MDKCVFIFDITSHFNRIYRTAIKNGTPNGRNDYFRNEPVFALHPLLMLINKEIASANNYGHMYSHIVMVFDEAGKNFRHDILPTYRSNKEPEPYEYTKQYELALKMFESQGFPCLKIPNVEADDVISSISSKLALNDTNNIIFSGNKRLLSLVNKNTLQYSGMNDTLYDELKVQNKFGVEPNNISDLLSMVGDMKTSIPGIPKVGEKTAAKILNNMSLNEFLFNPESITNINVRSNEKIISYVKKNAEELRLLKRVTALDKNIKLNTSLNKLLKERPVDLNYLHLIV